MTSHIRALLSLPGISPPLKPSTGERKRDALRRGSRNRVRANNCFRDVRRLRSVNSIETKERLLVLTVLLLTRNEKENIRLLTPRIRSVAEDLKLEYEILVIDASSDGTAELAESLGCRVVRQEASGYGSAFRLGIEAARGDFILTLDADHSHTPEFLRHMWALRDRADIVIGSRYVPAGRAHMPFVRKVLSRILNASFRRLLAMPVADMSSGYRLYRHSMFAELEILEGKDFDVLQEALVKAWCAGFRIREVPLDYRPRHSGRSNARAMAFAGSYLSTLKRLWTLRNSANSCDYDLRAFSSWVLPQRWWQRKRFEIVNDFLPVRGRSLDIGCGASQIIVSHPGMLGMDVNLKKMRTLRTSNPFLVQGSAFELPVASRSVSTVISSEVIEHIRKADILFSEMNRVLTEGGTLVLGTPDYATWIWNFVEYWYQKLLPNAYADEHISHYTHKELNELLTRFGFEAVAHRYVFGGELIIKARKVRDLPRQEHVAS